LKIAHGFGIHLLVKTICLSHRSLQWKIVWKKVTYSV